MIGWTLRDDIVRPDGSVPPIDATPNPNWNTATAGRQYGGDKPGVPNNPAQPLIGPPRCGTGGHPGISRQVRGHFFDALRLVFDTHAGVEL